MTSQSATAPSRLETCQNKLLEDVCGEVMCNQLKIFTHVDRQAAVICVKLQIDHVTRGHVTWH